MKLVLLAAMLLAASDLPRTVPDIPKIPKPWAEVGNRHARRRERKVSR